MLKPTVGPIIGHTTTHHARIFLRGELQEKRLVFAGIRYRRLGDEHWSKGVFAKLTSVRDMSAVLALNDLAADTVYEYQAGWFSPMSPVHTIETVQELPLQWPPQIHRLRTRSSQATQPTGLYRRLLPLSAADRRHCRPNRISGTGYSPQSRGWPSRPTRR